VATVASSAGAPRISVVGPLFNERENLPQLLAEIHEAMRDQGSYEVILVDDRSDDGSYELLRERQHDDPHLRLLRLPRRTGQSAALAAGLRAARGAIIATLDTDLQNDARDLPALIALLDDYDLLCGVRERRHDTFVKRASSRIANAIRRAALGDRLTDIGCGLRVGRASFLRDLPAFNGLHRFLPVLAARRGARVGEAGVSHRPRRFGISKYGVMDRAFRGLYDLIGVSWLLRRAVDIGSVIEVAPDTGLTTGS
jgi:dolichol-phosphate mannosyltransferase